MYKDSVFNITNDDAFLSAALQLFNYQVANNAVYRDFVERLNITIAAVDSLDKIPFLPISFFKSHEVITGDKHIMQTFTSSGTTGMTVSRHHIVDLGLYEASYNKGFENFYGNPEDYVILALLPNYLERQGSSLIYMVDDLIKKTKNPESGFYLNDLETLTQKLIYLDNSGKKVLLLGVSFALLNLVEKYRFELKNTIVMETGGMKGRRKEIIRTELHEKLCRGFGVEKIHSEYGMTELLSQAYSKGDGIFKTPNWMKVFTRDPEDSLTILPEGRTGGINIIDMANQYSCAFIATQDLGKVYSDGNFEILGRFDQSDIRGCNLMVV